MFKRAFILSLLYFIAVSAYGQEGRRLWAGDAYVTGGFEADTYRGNTLSATQTVQAASFIFTASDVYMQVGTMRAEDSGKALIYNATNNAIELDTVTGASMAYDHIDLVTTANDGQAKEGRFTWDRPSKTLAVGLSDNATVLQVGQTVLTLAANDTGSDMAAGTAVYRTGVSDGLPAVAPALASSAIAVASYAGLITSGIVDGATGYVTCIGRVEGIDTSSYAAGTELWVSAASAGAWTATRPTYGAYVGVVLEQDATDGVIMSRVRSIPWLGDLQDVDTTGAVDEYVLTWDAAAGLYKPALSSGGGGGVFTVSVGASNALDPTGYDYECDGTADQVQILAAIAALPAGGGAVLLSEGTFSVAATIDIATANVQIVGQGRATILQRAWNATSDEGVVEINTVTGTVLRDFSIDGVRATYTTSYNMGIYATDAEYSITDGLYIADCGGEGMYLRGSSSVYATVSRCVIDNCYAGIDCTTVDRYRFTSVNCINNTHEGFAIGTGSSFVMLDGCRAEGNGEEGFYVYNYATLADCVAYGNTDTGYYLAYVHNTMTGCVSYGNTTRGLYIGSDRNNIAGCFFYSNTTHGVSVAGAADNSLISGCSIYDNGGYGIFLANTVAELKISGNIIYDNSTNGILAYGTNRVTISDNTIATNTGYGITTDFGAASTIDLIITGNTFYNPDSNAVLLRYALRTVLSNNTFIAAGVGEVNAAVSLDDYSGNQTTLNMHGNIFNGTWAADYTLLAGQTTSPVRTGTGTANDGEYILSDAAELTRIRPNGDIESATGFFTTLVAGTASAETVNVTGDGSSYGVNIGTDGQIYRSATNELTTPDSVLIGTVTSTLGVQLQVQGDIYASGSITSNSSILYKDAVGPVDLNAHRDEVRFMKADVWRRKTPDKVHVAWNYETLRSGVYLENLPDAVKFKAPTGEMKLDLAGAIQYQFATDIDLQAQVDALQAQVDALTIRLHALEKE